jgi:hypothetical protein
LRPYGPSEPGCWEQSLALAISVAIQPKFLLPIQYCTLSGTCQRYAIYCKINVSLTRSLSFVVFVSLIDVVPSLVHYPSVLVRPSPQVKQFQIPPHFFASPFLSLPFAVQYVQRYLSLHRENSGKLPRYRSPPALKWQHMSRINFHRPFSWCLAVKECFQTVQFY